MKRRMVHMQETYDVDLAWENLAPHIRARLEGMTPGSMIRFLNYKEGDPSNAQTITEYVIFEAWDEPDPELEKVLDAEEKRAPELPNPPTEIHCG